MRKYAATLTLCLLLLDFQLICAQEFFSGSGYTGENTIGISLRYDGNLGVGLFYNWRNSGENPSDSPMNFNIGAEYRFLKRINTYGIELGAAQVVLKDDFTEASFGLGTRIALRFDHSVKGPNMTAGSNSSFKLLGSIKPGNYSQEYAAALNLNAALISLYFGGYNKGYRNRKVIYKRMDFRWLEQLEFGFHFDMVFEEEKGNSMMAMDFDHITFPGLSRRPMWNSWEDQRPANLGVPIMPRDNLNASLLFGYFFTE